MLTCKNIFSAQSKPIVMTRAQYESYYDQELTETARNCLKESKEGNKFWDGIVWCLDWIRNLVKNILISKLSKLPVIGTHASRLGVTVSEFLFTCIGTLTHFLRITFSTPQLWKKAHECAMKSWDLNENNGHLAQCYAYGKKMAAYFLEIIKQCLEKSIKANGMELSEEDKDNISKMLDEILTLD